MASRFSNDNTEAYKAEIDAFLAATPTKANFFFPLQQAKSPFLPSDKGKHLSAPQVMLIGSSPRCDSKLFNDVLEHKYLHKAAADEIDSCIKDKETWMKNHDDAMFHPTGQ